MNDENEYTRSEMLDAKREGARTMYELLRNISERLRILGKTSEALAVHDAATEVAVALGLTPPKKAS